MLPFFVRMIGNGDGSDLELTGFLAHVQNSTSRHLCLRYLLNCPILLVFPTKALSPPTGGFRIFIHRRM